MIHLISPLLADGTVQIVTQRVANSWEWYIIRASGFVSAGLLFLLMLSGIGHVTGLTYRVIAPVKAWAIHKAMALALCVSIATHGLFLLFDHFMPFSLSQILVPFVSHYSNGSKLAGLSFGNLAVSFGILAMYSIVIIVLSSLSWIDTRKRAWRWLHYLGYLVFILIFLHGLYAGSDLKYGTFRSVWIAFGLVIFALTLSRLARAGTLRGKASVGTPE